MANEKRLIDANALKDACRKTLMDDVFPNWRNMSNEERNIAKKIGGAFERIHDNAPTVDAVSRGVVDQIRWERDVAMKQLEEHGIPFGGIAPDVVKVVRCKDCIHHEHYDSLLYCGHIRGLAGSVSPNAFCSYGERKDNDRKDD